MPSLENGLVVRNVQLSRDLYEMEFIAPNMAGECQPGQFVHVKVGSEDSPLLRRPLSLYDVDHHLGSVILLYKVVGKGTALLSQLQAKNYVDVMGPLGRGFTLPNEKRNVLLVGGGVGIAPLVYLARELKERECNVKVVHGTQTRADLVAGERLGKIGVDFLPATMDGSAGCKGLVTDLLNKKVDPGWVDILYTCGPELMMAAVAEYARRHQIRGQVSLEEKMACGVGACLGCARQAKSNDAHYVKVCKEGPVFDLNDVSWEQSN
ncbi:MAG TPA: dihydroorotate dehydrogenase electron transfer subunit [Syntrophomonadaceae bacterium]|nr:dihydroorotate dehydrogenase electron transfer subunit [Syntrophomonadaceae bacterium]